MHLFTQKLRKPKDLSLLMCLSYNSHSLATALLALLPHSFHSFICVKPFCNFYYGQLINRVFHWAQWLKFGTNWFVMSRSLLSECSKPINIHANGKQTEHWDQFRLRQSKGASDLIFKSRMLEINQPTFSPVFVWRWV